MTKPQTQNCNSTNWGFQEAVRAITSAGGLPAYCCLYKWMCEILYSLCIGSKLGKVQKTSSCFVITHAMNSRAIYYSPVPTLYTYSNILHPPPATAQPPHSPHYRDVSMSINTHHIDLRNHINAGNINVHSYGHRGTCKPRWSAMWLLRT